jgi:hypothetical protein
LIWTVVAAGALVVPMAALASPHPVGAQARSAAAPAAGVVYGGQTPQDWPIVLELNKNRTRVVRAIIGLRLTCTSGGNSRVSDGYRRMPISRKRKFSASFGPQPERNDDGTISDWEGSINGALNASRSKLSGTWQLKAIHRDAGGVVVDTCDSGRVRWTAKQ